MPSKNVRTDLDLCHSGASHWLANRFSSRTHTDFNGDEYSDPVLTHVGIAHTRWATHGVPCERNSHPHRSDEGNSFVVVHNGIITNYNDVKTFLAKKGYEFESDTDTEVFAKLVHHLWKKHPNYSFRELVEQAIQQVVSRRRAASRGTSYYVFPFPIPLQEGAFAIAVKSKHFPGECVASRRSSPLLVGIKTKTRLATDHIPILYGKGESRISLSLSFCLSLTLVSYLYVHKLLLCICVCFVSLCFMCSISNCLSLLPTATPRRFLAPCNP